MLFPVSGVEVSVWVPPLVSMVISFFTSMGGVSGAFVLLPFQVSVLGYTSPSVSATNHVFNVVAIPSGVYRYIKEGRMVWPLTLATAIGTLPGVFLGSYIRVRWLPDPKHFKVFAGAVLVYIGLRLARDVIRSLRAQSSGGKTAMPAKAAAGPVLVKPVAQGPLRGSFVQGCVTGSAFGAKEMCFTFEGKEFRCSTPGVFAMSLVVGLIGGVYGIGGGSIIAPFMVSAFKLPVYTVAGAALAGTFLTSICGVAFFQMLSPWYPSMAVAPDWGLGLLFGAGGVIGMYLGARCQRFVPARAIKSGLALTVCYLGFKYLLEGLW